MLCRADVQQPHVTLAILPEAPQHPPAILPEVLISSMPCLIELQLFDEYQLFQNLGKGTREVDNAFFPAKWRVQKLRLDIFVRQTPGWSRLGFRFLIQGAS